MKKTLFFYILIILFFLNFFFVVEESQFPQFIFEEKINDEEKKENEIKEHFLSKNLECNIRLIKNFQTPGQAESIFVSGNYAYLADGYSGLEIFEVTNPEDPRLIGNFDTPGYSEGVFVLDNFVYVADKDGGFLILDVSEKEKPKLINQYPKISAEGVFVKDNFAYLAYAWWGIKIFDISDKNKPELIFEKNLSDESEAVFVNGNYLFVGKGNYSEKAKNAEFQIFDISEIKNPKLIYSHYPSEGYVESLFVKDNFLFLAADKAGLKIFDITNPQKPILVSQIKTPGSVENVFVLNNFAFLALGEEGFNVIDISNIKNPKLLGKFLPPGFTERIFAYLIEDQIYIFLAVKSYLYLSKTNLPIKNSGRLVILSLTCN